ncbi:MAG: dTDP-4-dehydrorhamnose reductase [Cellulomonas sp.]
MRWLVAGARGMLGQDMVGVLERAGHDVTATDRDVLDIADGAQVLEAVRGHDIVVNCAAWTAVDDAELHESEAFVVNAVGAARLARAAAQHGVRLVQISTDYVFSGDGAVPYEESSPLGPRSAYGRTKAAGEWAVAAECADHLIVRTAWLYGAGGRCFPKTIARLARERDHLDVVDDQVGQPTWTMDLADLVLRLVRAEAPSGTYHGTSTGETSWFDFARAVVSVAGLDPEMIRSSSSAAASGPAPRPAYSALGHEALVRVGVAPIGDWTTRWEVAASTVLA